MTTLKASVNTFLRDNLPTDCYEDLLSEIGMHAYVKSYLRKLGITKFNWYIELYNKYKCDLHPFEWLLIKIEQLRTKHTSITDIRTVERDYLATFGIFAHYNHSIGTIIGEKLICLYKSNWCHPYGKEYHWIGTYVYFAIKAFKLNILTSQQLRAAFKRINCLQDPSNEIFTVTDEDKLFRVTSAF